MAQRRHDGSAEFELFCSEIYQERWQTLKAALLEDSSPVLLSDRLTGPYYMDRASILAASCLPVKHGDTVLDMCAAPGGKTLVLALTLDGTGRLVANDRSAARRARLHSVIKNSLPPELAANISITGHDSTKWSLYEKNVYDCVLLDAPCSSERHVLKDPQALAQWSKSRPKALAVQQFAMLAAALDAVKPGGYILYSTCSINPMENTGVVEKLRQRRRGMFIEIPTESCSCRYLDAANGSEPLEHGRICLPDRHGGAGPLYFCLLRKSAEAI